MITLESNKEETWFFIDGSSKHKDVLPTFKTGMVIGVDVGLNRGSLSFWADGSFQLTVPVRLKGKSLFPALSVYHMTVMQVRSGMAPPDLL